MNSQKKLEINQSSLLGLKAELLRKKNEVSSAKYSQELTNTKLIRKKLTTKFERANQGVSAREERDAEEVQQLADELKRSQRILEEKAKLYEKLRSNALGGSQTQIDSSNFLVDFKQKKREEEVERREGESVESDYGDYSDDDEGWVDFVDCLGRTKRCLRDDLEAMKERDERLRVSLFGEKMAEEKREKEEKEEKEEEGGGDKVWLPQLCSEDMKREIMRQKWEEQERKLLDKKNIHYQDVLFDEARTHGVSYYAFSTDEEERLKQQEELRKLRKETQQQQTEAMSVAQKKQKQMEERLKAARRRKRERLGLPLEEEPEVSEAKEKEKTPEPVEELRRDVRKPGPVRAWDIGKEETRVLTQEEWVEKKRAERQEEFAPPSFAKRGKFQKREHKQREYYTNYTMEPELIEDELEVKETRGRGAEVPPPRNLDMYKPKFKGASQSDISRSIEEGLEFIRKRAEAKKASREVDESDIM